MDYRTRVAGITTWIAGVAAVAVALLLPLGYFTVSYQYLAGGLDTEAEMTSHIVTDIIRQNPDLWQYEQLRLEEALSRRMLDAHRQTSRVLDRDNRLVAESGGVLKRPLITRRFDLMDAGAPVGTLEISSSLYRLLINTGLAALLGLTCGMAIFITLRVLPLRAVERAEQSLLESKGELTDKVAQLEAALAKMKQLEGIIPICMYCKKIRDDKESWQQLEGYITEHSEAHFSHGICPECSRKVTSESLKELESLKR